MDQLAAMRAFARVVEAGTFTRAGERLNLPKSTITKLIQSLEAHVRTKLLNRTTRRVTVTPDGAVYYERVVRLLSDLDELDGSMTLSQASLKGRVRIDVSPSLANMIIIPALCEFHAKYPDIQIDLGVSDRPVDLIAENVDCVVRAGELTDQSLIARRVGELRFVTCAAPQYLQRHREIRHPNDLERDHYTVSYFSSRTGQPYPMWFAKAGEEIEIVGRHILSVNDGNAYLMATLSGHGVGQVPTFMAQPHITTGALQQVLNEWEAITLPLHVVYPPNRHLSSKLRAFVDWIADLFASHDLIRRTRSAA